MLSHGEKMDLENYENLDAKGRAKLNHALAKKIRTRLSDLKEMDEAITKIAANDDLPKTLKNAFNDEAMKDLLQLTEHILPRLEYSPIKNINDIAYVIKTEQKVNLKTQSTECWIRTYPATDAEVERIRLMNNHIKKLQKILEPPAIPTVGVIE